MSIKLKYQDEIKIFENEEAVEIYFDEKIREILLEEAEKIKKEICINSTNDVTQ